MTAHHNQRSSASVLGRPVIRTNGFFEGVEDSTNPAMPRNYQGEIQEEGFQKLDQLLDLAAQQGVRAVLAQALQLTDSPHNVLDTWREIIPQEQWPSDGKPPRKLFY